MRNALAFPASTEFNKRIPKQKFYENITVTPALKKLFVEQIHMIFWRNKIAAATTNLAPGTTVNEIEVFEIRLNSMPLDETVLRQIDKEIPYHILFLLTCDGQPQAWICYKEATASGPNAFKVSRYYHTDWMPENVLHLSIDGLNLDAVYENFMRQITKMQDEVWREEFGIAENIAQDEKKKQLEKQIAALESKMREEKQLNRRMEINAELKKLKNEVKSL